MVWDGIEKRKNKMEHEKCSDVIENTTKIYNLDKSFTEHKLAVEKSTDELWEVITEIRDKLLSRPSWAVTVIITILTSITVASITFASTLLKNVIR